MQKRSLTFRQECKYFMFPVHGGTYNSATSQIRRHAQTPNISAQKICVQKCNVFPNGTISTKEISDEYSENQNRFDTRVTDDTSAERGTEITNTPGHEDTEDGSNTEKDTPKDKSEGPSDRESERDYNFWSDIGGRKPGTSDISSKLFV